LSNAVHTIALSIALCSARSDPVGLAANVLLEFATVSSKVRLTNPGLGCFREVKFWLRSSPLTLIVFAAPRSAVSSPIRPALAIADEIT
jgi:hypothetical protein